MPSAEAPASEICAGSMFTLLSVTWFEPFLVVMVKFDLPVPPTYLFGLELEQPEPFAWITDLGVDMSTVLHGTQSFSYDAMTYAGDTLTVRSSITGLQDKRNGAMQLLERSSVVTRGEEQVATLTQTVVVLHREVA